MSKDKEADVERKASQDVDIEKMLKKEVTALIKDYDAMDLDKLAKAKIATEITLNYLKTIKDIHKYEDFGGGLDENV